MLEDSKLGKFDYDSWANNQLKDNKRKSILLWKAEQLASLVPPNIHFENALEIGCAEGIVINRLRELLYIQKCYGIDVSHTFLSQGKAAYPKVEFTQVSGGKYPFSDKSMDLIVLSDIIEHIKDLRLFMKEIKRVGKMVLLKVPLDKYLWRKLVSEPLGRSFSVGSKHPDGHLHEFSKNSCEKMLKDMGFKILVSKVVYRYIGKNDYKKKHAILKPRWFLDTKLKQLFPRFAHAIFGGNLIVLLETS
jgi:ubiquinone/menaquinone biosynthesis C-methylase UbiE